MKLIDTNLLTVFWQAIKEFEGNLQCIARQSRQDIKGNNIEEYYEPKSNVTNKGDRYHPVYFDSNGVAKIIDNFSSDNIIADQLRTNDVGNPQQPIYLEKGIPKAFNSNIGGQKQPIYIDNGNVTPITASVGSSSQPIYLDKGEFKTCNIFPKSLLLEICYPIGSIYSSTVNNSPENFLGGEWKSINGRFLFGVGANNPNTTNEYGNLEAGIINRPVKEMGGEPMHTLVQAEMPTHAHEKGTMRIKGTFYGSGQSTATAKFTGPFYREEQGNGVVLNNDGKKDDIFGFDTDKNDGSGWTGKTSLVGGNVKHNNMPPYYSVYMWERVK